ncbi:MAG: HAD-IIB family hydrolase [Clostridiales bacterium]|nr:HAD-IIB family hydrolase [Clostridiales bacterium]
MKFKNVLIASDFDGTLKNDSGEVTADVIEAIRCFKDNGGYFTLSTGRTYQGLTLYDNSVFNAPALLANGAMAYDFNSKEIVFFDGLYEEGKDAVRKLHERFPEISIEMYPFDDTYAINLTEESEKHFTNQGIIFNVVDSPDGVPLPWAKVMLGCPAGLSADVQRFIAEKLKDVSYLPTTGSFVEIVKKGVNKGSGLLKLADCLGVKKKDVYAVGDGYNDTDMLTAASAAFVPCNGSSEALSCASYVVRSNNDGAVKNVIEILDTIYK